MGGGANRGRGWGEGGAFAAGGTNRHRYATVPFPQTLQDKRVYCLLYKE